MAASFPGCSVTTFIRREVVLRDVELPEGHEVCSVCEGRGMLSKYDRGWRSLVHSAELAALRSCDGCGGRGHREKL